jgi:DNA-binding NtrC family response regulator
MRQGAYDFQSRPILREKLLEVLRRGFSDQALRGRMAEIERELDERFGVEDLVARSRPMLRVLDLVRRTAAMMSPVLIEGEPGTGKEVVAHAIHRESRRRERPFVRVRCGLLAPDGTDVELFGYEDPEKAGGIHAGWLERADGGTLYLDELGEASAETQARLLRLLAEHEFTRAGGATTLRADVRLIAATSRDLAAEVAGRRFRRDLLDRLGLVRVTVPPLRERREDLPPLAQTFVRESNRAHRRHAAGLTPGVLERFERYPWPGNVRELRDVIDAMVAAADRRRPLGVADLPLRLRETPSLRLQLSVGMTVGEAERHLIEATLEHAGGDKRRAAAMLGIGLRTLYRKIEAYGLR